MYICLICWIILCEYYFSIKVRQNSTNIKFNRQTQYIIKNFIKKKSKCEENIIERVSQSNLLFFF